MVLTPVWVAGVVWSLRSAVARRFRPVAIACVLVITLQFVLGGKAYYPGGAFTFLLAAGCVPLERRLAGRTWPGRLLTPAVLAGAAMVAGAMLAAPVALSVLPARVLHTVPLQKINYDLAETIAWPKLVTLVAQEYHSLPAAQRRHATILAGNYGEAGAIERYGPGAGLPQAYSGANNFWLWGPPPASDSAAIAVNVDPALLRREFAHVRQVATFWNGLGVSDDEQGAQIFIATGLQDLLGAGLARVPQLLLTRPGPPPARPHGFTRRAGGRAARVRYVVMRPGAMRRPKPSSEAEQQYKADVALAARRHELLEVGREVEDRFRQAQTRHAPVTELRRLAEELDAALTAAVRGAYAARRAAIGPLGYDDRIYRRKAMAKPHVHALTAEAEHLLTLRENHRLNGIPAVPFESAV